MQYLYLLAPDLTAVASLLTVGSQHVAVPYVQDPLHLVSDIKINTATSSHENLIPETVI